MSLVDRFAGALAALRPGSGPALVAVSGGLDSVVLLDLLVRTRGRHGLELIVAHADHGIHPESALVAGEVEALALRHGLRSVTGVLALGPDTTETEARAARYRWLRATRRRLGVRWILTAHQADDQAETVLMRMLRGSGPRGLAAMRGRDRDLLRPLLRFSFPALYLYARRRELRWWNDPANRDTAHLRSWIRVSLLPKIAGRLPDIHEKLAQTRRHAVRERKGWDAALRRWPGLAARLGRGGCSVDWPVLRDLPEPLAATLTESLLRAAGGPAGPIRIERALAALAAAPSGARADLGQGWRLEIAFDRLRVLAPDRRRVESPLVIDHPAGEASWGGWQVRWATEPAPPHQSREGRTAWFTPQALELRVWRPGDRLAPLGGRGHRLAVRCFQEARIPRSERLFWPMIEGEGALAWIPGVCRSGRLLPVAGTPSLRVDVEPRR